MKKVFLLFLLTFFSAISSKAQIGNFYYDWPGQLLGYFTTDAFSPGDYHSYPVGCPYHAFLSAQIDLGGTSTERAGDWHNVHVDAHLDCASWGVADVDTQNLSAGAQFQAREFGWFPVTWHISATSSVSFGVVIEDNFDIAVFASVATRVEDSGSFYVSY